MYHCCNYQQPLPTAQYYVWQSIPCYINCMYHIYTITFFNKSPTLSNRNWSQQCHCYINTCESFKMHNSKDFIGYKFDTAVCVVNIAMCKLNCILLAPFPKNSRPNSQAVIRIYVWHLEMLNISDWHDIYYVFKRILSIPEVLAADNSSCKGSPLEIKQFCESFTIMIIIRI